MSLAFVRGMPPLLHRLSSARGTTLLETLIGLGLLAVLMVTMAWLLAFGRDVTDTTRRRTLALALARARLAQLEGLAFARATLPSGGVVEVTDLVTDLSGPEPALGGVGLADGPADTLLAPRAFYTDYLDSRGRWTGRDDEARRRAAFVRRWRVRRLRAGSGELVALEVMVAPQSLAARAEPRDLLVHPDVVRLGVVRSRRAR
jgi:hypothetical protein